MKRTLVLLITALTPVLAQMQNNQDKKLACNDNSWGDRAHYCEMREQTLGASGQITVDGGMNGGVTIKGWDRGDVLVRAKIDTNADSDAEAKAIAGQIHVQMSGSNITASGPSMADHSGWGVSFEVFVPHSTSVNLKAHNGGVAIWDVQGQIEFNTVNGGVSLKRLAGTVHGSTQNGGLNVELMGDRWNGSEMDVATTNGGVKVKMPANYSAHLETSTVNGGMSLNFPITISGHVTKQLAVDIGNGGPTIRVKTVNGGVSIEKTT